MFLFIAAVKNDPMVAIANRRADVINSMNGRGNDIPNLRTNRITPFVMSNDDAPFRGATSDQTADVGEVTPATKKSKGDDSTGGPTSPGGDGIDSKADSKTPVISSSPNTWATTKLLIATGASAIGSFVSHFTNLFGEEGLAKNFFQYLFDFGAILGLALTASSALATKDEGFSTTHHNLN